jgi:uncharacterized protein
MKKSEILNKFGAWAIVTGASSGIGEAFAHHLASLGFNLLLVARREDLLTHIGNQLRRKHGIDFKVIPLDLSVAESYQEIIAAAKDLDVGLLISNAGTGKPGAFLNQRKEDLAQIIELNTASHVWLTQHFAGVFAAKGKGGIVLTGAMGATNGLPYMAVEAGTKAFIEAWGLSLNHELKDKNVHLTVLVTSPTQTPVLGKLGFTNENLPMKPISAEQCVKETLEALYVNKATIIPGLKFKIMNALTPKNVGKIMMGKILKKNNNI